MTDFKHQALKELTDQQVRFAPPARRQEQVARAERLLGEIEPARVYPYQFVCFRVTDYRSDAHPDLLIPGADLKHDLALFIQRVERSLPPLPVEQAVEPMLTLEEVSQRVQRLDQDDQPVADAGAGGPAGDPRRPQAARVPEVGGGAVRRRPPRSGGEAAPGSAT